MNQDLEKMNPYLMQLILSLQAAAMQQMGKVMNPVSNKIERDLIMARNSIEMLSMIDEKMKGNLSEEETKLLSHVLYELRLNYVDETKKNDEQSELDNTKENVKSEDIEKDDK